MYRKITSVLLSIVLLVSTFAGLSLVKNTAVAATVYTEQYFPACASSYTTLIPALDSLGIDSSKANRASIAAANGITNYTYTAEQNTLMLNLLKQGKLLNPDYVSGDTEAGLTFSDDFKAYVYHINSFKLVTPDSSNNAVIYKRKGDGSQLLRFKKNSSGKYLISSGDLYLTVVGNASKAGTNVTFSAYTGGTGQQWTVSGKDGYYKLKAACASSCHLEVTSNATANGTNVKINTTASGDKQYFQILHYNGDKNMLGYTNGYAGGSAGDGKKYCKGIDISKHNGSNYNFTAVKNAGYKYVIIRAGSTNLGKDPLFEQHYAGAKAAGLDVGAYFYTYALDTTTARSDARKFINYVRGKKFEYPLYIDYEDPSQESLSKATSKNMLLTMATMLANEGYLAGVYSSYSTLENLYFDDICEVYDSWAARFTTDGGAKYSSTYSKIYGMYQFSSTQTISGISNVVDANYSYKDYPTIVKKYGFNGYPMGSWVEDSAGFKYVYTNGQTANGWLETDNKKYYLGENGYRVTGWTQFQGKLYNFDSDGALTDQTGIVGDADCSGVVNISDVTYLQKISAGTATYDEMNVVMGDVSGDKRLSIRDATYIQLHLAVRLSAFPICK